ncbi:conjugal transfer protein TraL [Gilliamella sp. HK2]|jgi:nitrogenase subunit NifH|uniref:nucleotide-binding protein n=1 Tax=unclassified Gilliamella TaxID=2685620 RepID=UPI00080E6402|nr:conjugal transfer protein TraL [Gilliamella apicola]OCG28993.1 conjugal transfer protein TraL [Gilliamella apicola]OCG31442.1 conjugal transfer protein TraL [Gilliamella apicola]
MAKIHMLLQGKGGVGKSLISSILAQYIQYKHNILPCCIDTDPVNSTFGGYRSLNVKTLHLLENDEINTRNIDTLIEWIAATNIDAVIDNGAATFVPLAHYIISNQIADLLETMGHKLIVHTVITGGQALVDTINGFAQLVKQFPENIEFVVWLNEFWGKIEAQSKNFEEMKAYKDYKNRVSTIIRIPSVKEETFGKDISEMLKNKQTFKEAIEDKNLSIMSRQRLNIYKDKIFTQLNLMADI